MAGFREKVIGGFRVLAEIQAGSGAQGTVYKAICDEDKYGLVPVGALVALKVMPVQDEGQTQWRRLEKRTKELAKLRHQSVVRYYGCFAEQGTFNDVHVVVQEFLDGETLKERLARQLGGLDVDEALHIVAAALEGLAYTTGAGIVHRDIKPGNIFLCKDGSVKLIDFEIAKKEGGTVTTAGGNIRGSFDYMAPDFTNPEFHGDERSDIFSMGVVLHEALTGKLPYQKLEGDDKQAHFAFLARWALQASRGTGSPIRVSSRVRRLLAHTEDVFAKSLAPKREDRYPDFTTFLEGIRKVKFRNLQNGKTAYQMLQFIGKGGFGEVFKARDKRTGQLVAVKHLLKAEYAERFHREAKIMKKLRSPCFVRFVDFFELNIAGNRESFLAMAFLDGMPGSSLRDSIKREKGEPLDMRSALIAFERYARGLWAMHQSGVFHRDIKPSNLYYPPGRPEHAAIMDFGIARDINGTATSGQVPGTLDYMPPEVVLSDSRGDAGMDIYALGLCLYESLTGKTAYPRLPSGTAGYAAFFERSRNGVRPSFDVPQIAEDKDVLSLLREMTEIDPAKRIGDASAVAARLAQIIRSRFGDDVDRIPELVDSSGPETLDETMTLTPTVYAAPLAVESPTQGTIATQAMNLELDEVIRREKDAVAKRRLRKLVAKVAAVAVVLAAVGVGAYYSWPVLKEQILRPSDQPREDHPSQPDPEPEPQDPMAMRRIKIGADCFTLINQIEPVETRQQRLEEARNMMDENSVNGTLDEAFIKNLASKIDERQGWIVGVLTNATETAISVAGKTIEPGERRLFRFENGRLPEKWTCSARGYDDFNLPEDFDGRTVAISDGDLVPRAVTMKLPQLDKGVSCIYDGKSVEKLLVLRPGSYSCRYTRPGYADQSVSFVVEFDKDGVLPAPRKWNASAVRVSCPELDAGVVCKVDGNVVSSKELMLAPGKHVCEYVRVDYEPQYIPFDVEVLAERSLPTCGTWVENGALKALAAAEDAVKSRDWEEAAEYIAKADVKADSNVARREKVSKAIADAEAERMASEERRKKKAEAARQKKREDLESMLDALCAYEPLITRQSRLDKAKEEVGKALSETLLSEAEAKSREDEISARKRWIVGRVANGTQSVIEVDGRTIPPSGSELFVFKDGLPSAWKCSAHGYEETVLDSNLDGRTISVSQGDLVPRAVTMSLPSLERGVVCIYDERPVSGSLALRPGRHSCRYTKPGCEDQEVSFDVLLGKDGVLPQPGVWSVKSVTVRFKSPDAGVVCRVDGNAVDRDVKLKPGSHSVVYERDDYVPQEYEFNVEVGTPRDLPACGAWVETEALKALHDAESAARNGNWLVVDRRLKAAGVVSPGNVERRDRLAETSQKQVVIQKKIRQAMDYYQDMEYYEYVKAYYEAFLLGHVLSDDEKLEVKAKCDEQIARLRKDIDTYDKEVAKGRVGFVRDLNSMKEKRANLTNWRRELTE